MHSYKSIKYRDAEGDRWMSNVNLRTNLIDLVYELIERSRVSDQLPQNGVHDNRLSS